MNIFEAWSSGWSQILSWFSGIFDFLWDNATSFINGIFNGDLAQYIGSWFNNLGLSIAIPQSFYNGLNELFIGIGYIVPVRALLPIPAFFLSFYIIKLVFAIYRAIAGFVVRRIKVKV